MTGLSLCGVLSIETFSFLSPEGKVSFIITQAKNFRPFYYDSRLRSPCSTPRYAIGQKLDLLLKVFPPRNADVKCKLLAENILLLVFIISALILLSHNAIILTRLQGRDAQTYQLP